ncbi:MAG: hypothetical protein LAP87_19000 [Acidobacteriia bacterium]|nr:hypothetical protein [Terriglobia bacterium]
MIIECADLDRALAIPELMPDARAHAERCERCRHQLYLWGEISRLAPQLHADWESPSLWPRIRAGLAAEPARRVRTPVWRWALAAAAMVAIAGALLGPWRSARAPARDFLTEGALQEVQQAESAYARSIERLSAVAAPGLQQSPGPLAAAYREKLLLLDTAISDLTAHVERNRYNTYLRTELASLYREKQKTLQEWVAYAKRN